MTAHTGVLLRRAEPREAALLSTIAVRSKAHWGYAPDVLAAWAPELTISADEIGEQETFVAIADDRVCGFYSLSCSGDSWELEHMWVVPELMRRGIGRALLAHALETATRGGAHELVVEADPNAERFYLANGAQRRGERPAAIDGDPARVRPQLAFRMAGADLSSAAI